MKAFMDKDFLLETDTEKLLYHEYAAKLPVIDFHCHLEPRMVAENHQFDNITQLWLDSDIYKWRAMRANGVDERYITGDAGGWEKFEKWAETVSYCYRNPLYHWTHLELRTVFGIDKLLTPETAREIYETCNEKLATPDFRARGLMRRYQVECVCTINDPVDDLCYHVAMEKEGDEVRMLPTWRPDFAMNIDKPGFADYMERLGEAAGMSVVTFVDMVEALQRRHDYFAAHGCRLSDHVLEEFYDAPYTDSQIETIFSKAMRRMTLPAIEARQYKHCFLMMCAEMDARAGWTQQYHYGLLRDNNSLMYRQVGAGRGFDSVGEFVTATAMAHFFNCLAEKKLLARTIIYTVNPWANEMVAAMAGIFQDGTEPGKMQLGIGGWFNDHLGGMAREIEAISNLGLLARSVGMPTDSCSFLSYSRHEYFRRLLCHIIGSDVDHGLIPADRTSLVRMVEDVCYYNARRYFHFYDE